MPTFKQRHLFSARGLLRLRYVTLFVCAISALGVGGFIDKNYASKSISLISLPKIEISSIKTPQNSNTVSNQKTVSSVFEFKNPLSNSIIKTKVLEPTKPAPIIVKIKSGDTLSGALQRGGFSSGQAYRAVKASSKYLDPRKIRPGQTITIEPFDTESENPKINASITINPIKKVLISSADDSSEITAQLKEAKVIETTDAASGKIKVSLYGSAEQSGMPDAIIADLIRIYSWDVDFQRDIRAGDTFEALYTMRKTEDGHVVGSGDVLYAKLVISGLEVKMYRFKDEDGVSRYFGEDGKGIKKALMKTPVDGARISSRYGMRRHPVSGYSKMHKGIDFAAPAGTPIYAAGDGVIERANRFSSYGNYIKIRHAGGLETAYAHLKGFAKGISKGARVEQGQVIGYIGTTGRSTGPHLHYEVLKSGKQVNPSKVKQPVGGRLKGQQLAKFKESVSEIDKQYAALEKQKTTQLASNDN